jgi:hypothetical protein
MGWTTFNKPDSISPSQYFKQEFASEPNHELLDIAIVKRNTAYMAVKIKETGKVYAFVYMLTYDNKSYYNFGYKPMTEFVGPYQHECPERILKLLSPLDESNDSDGWAKKWREECYKTLERRKNKIKLSEGDIIKTVDELQFTCGGKYRFFRRAQKANRFFPLIELEDGNLIKSNNYVKLVANKYEFEIVGDKKLVHK